MKTLFSSESVCNGHPDKVCDQISDAILDAILEQDPQAHVACETVASKNLLVITGEVTTNAKVDYEAIARNKIKEIGYTRKEWDFKYDEIEVLVHISTQSADINQGVDLEDGEVGAGDQGMMFGYACNETKTLMPLSFDLASKLCHRLDDVKKEVDFLGPDGKGQVSVEFEDGKAVRVDTVVLSNQHLDSIDLETLRAFIKKEVIDVVIPAELMDENTKIYINPTGRFVIGGPIGDAGLTGRKIIVDTYGGYGQHGGGAFSGKDPSKVDRSGAYYGRYVAKHLVAAGLCDRAMVQVAYAIGVSKPVSLYIDTYGTNKVEMSKIYEIVEKCFDLRVTNIIKELDLRKPMYQQLAAYGHMGREELNVSFEQLTKLDQIKALLAE